MRGFALLAFVAIGACGPRVRVDGPGEAPVAGSVHGPVTGARAGGPPVAVGEMCPDKAAGRAAVSVVLLGRGLSWSDELGELDDVVTRGEIADFSVLDWAGKRAGVFTVAGATEIGTTGPVAAGGYAGASPCADEATRAACQEALRGCGLAVGGVGRDAEGTDVEVGRVCIDGARLILDLDGDGAAESFPIAELVDQLRAPSEEVVGAQIAPPASCPRVFAQANLLPNLAGKGWRGLDLIGVADLDADGRKEIILQFRYAEKRTWAIYSATQIATRIELVAEVEPWAR